MGGPGRREDWALARRTPAWATKEKSGLTPIYVRQLAWIIVGLLVILGFAALVRVRPEQPGVQQPAVPTQASVPPPPPAATSSAVQVIAQGLEVPWALAFGPDGPSISSGSPRAESRGGTLYVTERPGRLVRIRDGKHETIARIPNVSQRAESGLLGLALDPEFSESGLLYIYYTTTNGANRVVRYQLTDAGLTNERVLLDGIPAAVFHDGGRIAFGPDRNLYVTTGDAGTPELAQSLDSLAGKILRVRSDGSIPDDNPFAGSPVYSLGHRNPQGLAWAADGTLYATEHGPSGPGAACCHDEVNRIEPGKNYGWPVYAGNKQQVPGDRGLSTPNSQLVTPLVESGPAETWAPGGAAIVGDTLFFGGLRGEALFALDLRNPTEVVKRFSGEFGRIRDVVRGPDGALYLTTSNRDGRGMLRQADDRVLRVDPNTVRP